MTARAADQRWAGWQTVDTGRLALLSGAAMLVAVAVAVTAVRQVYEMDVAVAFGLYIAFGELLRLVLPGGREAAPIAMSAALAYAMILTVAGPPHQPAQPQHFLPQQIHVAPPMQVVVVAATGMVLGSLPHIAAG
ncbi:MAG TPA: phosphohydrolase, partial [Streptosporangiaceae bacterium]